MKRLILVKPLVILGTAFCLMLAGFGLGSVVSTPASAWPTPDRPRPGSIEDLLRLRPSPEELFASPDHSCEVTSFIDRKLNAVVYVGRGTCAGVAIVRVRGDQD